MDNIRVLANVTNTWPATIIFTRYSTASFVSRFIILRANQALILSNSVLPSSCAICIIRSILSWFCSLGLFLTEEIIFQP